MKKVEINGRTIIKFEPEDEAIRLKFEESLTPNAEYIAKVFAAIMRDVQRAHTEAWQLMKEAISEQYPEFLETEFKYDWIGRRIIVDD